MSASFREDNAAYETWLRSQCDVVERDLAYKHKRMKKNAFVFLRATYFRWAKLIRKVCPDLKDAPKVLSVGDLHVENFGTWRDAEGRLVWGVNDFDEAATMPYPFDLVRLAASVRLSPKLRIANRTAATAILTGYREGLVVARPTLLNEHETWMQPYVTTDEDVARKFWSEVKRCPDGQPPSPVVRNLAASLPPGASIVRFATRVKGGGSLGRPRYLAIAQWRGGQVVREAKALVPSAWNWAQGNTTRPNQFDDLARGLFRSPDPFLAVKQKFVMRRIAPDSRKVDLGDDAGRELTIELLRVMGFDVGSIHAGTKNRSQAILDDLKRRPKDWLHAAANSAAHSVKRDYAEWISRSGRN